MNFSRRSVYMEWRIVGTSAAPKSPPGELRGSIRSGRGRPQIKDLNPRCHDDRDSISRGRDSDISARIKYRAGQRAQANLAAGSVEHLDILTFDLVTLKRGKGVHRVGG